MKCHMGLDGLTRLSVVRTKHCQNLLALTASIIVVFEVRTYKQNEFIHISSFSFFLVIITDHNLQDSCS